MPTSDIESLLEFAETLIHSTTETYCSELQRQILITALRGERKTYEQLADECGYSPKYVKHDVGPKVWQLISAALNQKVTKSNVRFVLERENRQLSASQQSSESQSVASVAANVSVETQSFDSSTIPESKANILLVDDQPNNLRLLSEMLEHEGYSVRQTVNGTLALRAVTLKQPDLILLDIHMPEMDGYEVCQQLKAEPATRDIPIIFVSAVDESWDKVRAFSAGAADYITKPFKVVEVMARVENQLKIQQLQRALQTQNCQLQQAIKELRRLAAIDEFTQVASRRRSDQYLRDCWQRALQRQTQLTLMLCHLENPNLCRTEINPHTSDQYLYEVAQIIKQTMQGPDDLVGRYGTFTFAIVLPDQMFQDSIAQRLVKKVQSLSPPDDSSVNLRFGVVSGRVTDDTRLEAWVEGCDRNLQQTTSDQYVVLTHLNNA
ncbi:MAG: response regulator [Leptolyngbya sp. SIO3F4]|nr:response regulator [Leptolyngbya sp. SIO3F4]